MLHAEFSLAPLLFLAAFAVMSSLAKNRQRGARRPPAADPGPGPDQSAGFMSELRRAMEELNQAQHEQSPQAPPDRVRTQLTPQTPQEKLAAEWLIKMKARKAQATGRVRSARPVVPLEDDDADKSSESGASLEGRDYDDEATQVAEARRQAAEHRVARTDESSETLSTLQQARRASRQAEAIGGSAEHAAWHGEIRASAETVKPVKPARRLGRFVDGTARSAIVLGEILKPPVGQRGA